MARDKHTNTIVQVANSIGVAAGLVASIMLVIWINEWVGGGVNPDCSWRDPPESTPTTAAVYTGIQNVNATINTADYMDKTIYPARKKAGENARSLMRLVVSGFAFLVASVMISLVHLIAQGTTKAHALWFLVPLLFSGVVIGCFITALVNVNDDGYDTHWTEGYCQFGQTISALYYKADWPEHRSDALFEHNLRPALGLGIAYGAVAWVYALLSLIASMDWGVGRSVREFLMGASASMRRNSKYNSSKTRHSSASSQKKTKSIDLSRNN